MSEKKRTSVVTLHRRIQLCKATSGGISAISPITHVAFGDGGTDGDGKPIMPLETATALNNEIARYPINSVSYPIEPPTTARYTVSIPENDMAGAKITEAALVDSDGFLHAIKTFYVKQKDAEVVFTFVFDDEF